jgi:hypothetical protein
VLVDGTTGALINGTALRAATKIDPARNFFISYPNLP